MAQKSSSRLRVLLRIIVWALVVILFLPVVEVLAVRYLNPFGTPLMLIRRIEGRTHAGPAAKPSYQWINFSNVPQSFLKCVWQTEDARFFNHKGFDWIEVDRSVSDAKRTGRPARGASTITMQCARSLFLWQGRSWIRKPLEAYYTILMEMILTKHRILELYVNVIEMGDGIYGVEAAARNYWHISARQLTPRQSVLLTSIIPNPRTRNPLQPSANVRRRAAMIEKKLVHSPALPLLL